MNIRKFIGATSRDALRQVREVLGPDAVVLSNRTLDDGSVEIVAVADRELAAIAPAAGEGANAGAASRGLPRSGAAPVAGNPVAGLGGNPYANGMPDVFSSVFGASPEAGAGRASTSDDEDDAPSYTNAAAQPVTKPEAQAGGALTTRVPALDRPGAFVAQSAAQSAGQADSGGGADRFAAESAAIQAGAPARPAARPGPAHAAGHATTQAPAASRGAPFATPAAGVAMPASAAPSYSDKTRAPRTMAETNPWLIDHARRIADKDSAGQGEGHSAKAAGMTPADAMAKGLGMPADPHDEHGHHRVEGAGVLNVSTPDWAREAAQLAARRATQRIAPAFDLPGNSQPATPPSINAKAPSDAAGASASASVTEAIKARIEQVVNETVMSELASMRGMMEEQFAGLLWGERQRRSPTHGALTKQLFAAGFSAQLVKMVVDNLPEGKDPEGALEWAQSVLESNLPVLENEDALMERGGVFALMGPTGVGKTTTTAKLAARCVMRFGASKVALLTTDSYRIGGHEQLRIFGRILGVSVHAVRDGADLQLALTELKNKHIVLIDTIGMSQRDRAVTDQIAMLCSAGQPVQRLLLMSATSHGDTLNEVVQAYQSTADKAPLAGCILTKLDEATNLGGALDTVLRYRLPVHYVSTGQKVPENLYVATKRFLIRSAFCIPREHSPFVPHEDDIPALLSALSTRSNADLHEVRFG
ncbi:flagellar biosynthesis protein FlhF [Paraburkholderia kururiensis]|uniref:Flagellar biosynthesis protein FlhF n=1 Tax=Paraburkholderia kururiensis TaxID=984307 RepID=A0ABZ0WFJ8_9BURK|nr:flagellar biosynthesis protein FlhF [Paraburkholderia kururiensis]WQD76140.1 flagellar biosynthesis protein FlhF [Paraburkholderia kururiensis]